MDDVDGQGNAAPRLLGLDGLRGVAIVAVVLFHGGVGLDGGALGVDLFLVLSGYLITTLLVRELGSRGRVDLSGFWGRRLRRLLPALLVVVAVVAVHGAVFGGGDPGALRDDALATLGYVANWRFAGADSSYFAAFGAPSPLRHTWSLAVEEQWYLLWPPTLWLLWRGLGRRPALLTAALLALAGVSAGLMARWADDLDRVHYGTDTRAQGLLVGAALAVWLRHRPAAEWTSATRRRVAIAAGPALALVVVAFFVAAGTERWLYEGGHLAFAVASAVAVLGAILPGPVRIALSLRPLRWLGAVSYGLYLWHWPVFVWLTPSGTDLGRWPLFAVRLGISLALAAASARWIERPFRRPHRQPEEPRHARRVRPARHATPVAVRPARSPRPGLTALGATALVAVVVVGATAVAPDDREGEVTATPDLPEGFDLGAATAAVAASPTTTALPSGLPAARPAPDDGTLDVLVVGDSTGWTLAYGAPPLPGVTVQSAALLGCGIDPAPVVLDGVAVVIDGDPVDCVDGVALWNQETLRVRPDVILVSIGAWEVFDRWPVGGDRLDVGTPAWRTWLDDSLERVLGLLASSAPQAEIAVADVPCYEDREDALGGPASARNDPVRVAAVNEVLAGFAAANPARVTVLPMSSWVCPGGVPIGVVDGVTMRPDGVHLGRDGAPIVWNQDLVPALQDLVAQHAT